MIEALGECLVCGGGVLVPFLDLGEIPLVNVFVRRSEELATERRFPLQVSYCDRCRHVQLGHTVSAEALFSEYIYLTGSSESVRAHASRLRELARAAAVLDAGRLVVEIGSNDGTVLQEFKAVSGRVLGVEPARNIAEIARASGIPTVAEFFTEELARDLGATHGRAAVIVARNVLAHVPALRGFAGGVARLLASDGLALIEVPYLVDLLDYAEFDTIYHEHLSYFSVTALRRLFGDAGLELVDVTRLRLHGGSLLLQLQASGGPRAPRPAVESFLRHEHDSGLLTPERFGAFAARVAELRREIPAFVRSARARPMRLAGYGASAKGNVLLNVCGLSADDIGFLVDRNPHKHGLLAPGTGIPVFPVSKVYEEEVECLVLLAWNFADEIVRQQQRFEASGGRFIVPFPRPQFITSGDVGRPELRHLQSSGTAV